MERLSNKGRESWQKYKQVMRWSDHAVRGQREDLVMSRSVSFLLALNHWDLTLCRETTKLNVYVGNCWNCLCLVQKLIAMLDLQNTRCVKNRYILTFSTFHHISYLINRTQQPTVKVVHKTSLTGLGLFSLINQFYILRSLTGRLPIYKGKQLHLLLAYSMGKKDQIWITVVINTVNIVEGTAI